MIYLPRPGTETKVALVCDVCAATLGAPTIGDLARQVRDQGWTIALPHEPETRDLCGLCRVAGMSP